MNRRKFCRTTLAAGFATAYPVIPGCERSTPAASRLAANIPAVSLDGSELELEKAAISELAGSLAGDVLLTDSTGYNSARKIWNGMHDKRPALIVRCLNPQDVSHAVTFARERGLLLAVRGGGHSWPGRSVCDGGMMVDLSRMNQVNVNATAKRAHAQGGALLGTLDTATRQHGLITTAGVVSHTGIGGFTLGGGFGRLNRKFGLAIDNLKSATIVTADGAIRVISNEQEEDLFWAIRGGGGNFGIVTEFEFQLYPFELEVLSGNIIWPIEQAREILDFWAEWSPGLSDELYVGPTLATTPEGNGVVLMEVVYAGDPGAGEKELAPLMARGKPLDNGVRMNDYMMMQTQEDGTFAHGIRSYAKNGMVSQVTPELVDAMLEAYVQDPRLAFFTHTAGGAVARVDELATAFPHRNAETMIIVAGAWQDPQDDDDVIERARNWFGQLDPFTGGYYDNIEFDGEATDRNYGPAHPRLARLKGRYDPGNLFRLNSNIQPVI